MPVLPPARLAAPTTPRRCARLLRAEVDAMVVLAARSHIRGDRFFLGEMKMDAASLILVLQHTTTFTTTEDGEDPTRGRDGREAKETQKKRSAKKGTAVLCVVKGSGT